MKLISILFLVAVILSSIFLFYEYTKLNKIDAFSIFLLKFIVVILGLLFIFSISMIWILYHSKKIKTDEEKINLADISVRKEKNIEDLIKAFNNMSILLKENVRLIKEYVEILQTNYETEHQEVEKLTQEKEEFYIKTTKYDLLHQISKALKSSKTKKECYDVIVEIASKITKSNRVSLMALDEKEELLKIVATRGWSDSEKKLDVKLKIGEGIAGKVIQKNIRVLVTDIETDPEWKKVPLPKYKTKSFISLPFRKDGKPFAVLNLTEKQTEEGIYNNEDLEMVNFITEEASSILPYLQ